MSEKTVGLDAFNREILIGDEVAFSDTRFQTSSMKSGRVLGFTSKKIRISSTVTSWRSGSGGLTTTEILKFPEQVVRITL